MVSHRLLPNAASSTTNDNESRRSGIGGTRVQDVPPSSPSPSPVSYVIVGQATPVLMNTMNKSSKRKPSFSMPSIIKLSLFVSIQIYMYYQYTYVLVVRNYGDNVQNGMATFQPPRLTSLYSNQQQQNVEGRGSPIFVNNFYGPPPQSWGLLIKNQTADTNNTTEGTSTTKSTSTVSQEQLQQPEYACNNLQWNYYHPFQHGNTNNEDNLLSSYVPSSSPSWNTNLATIQHKPMFVPSFPGSGAELFRTLINAFTGGIPGWSVYDDVVPPLYESCHSLYAITCKTHWPVLTQKSPRLDFFLQNYDPAVILLIRNPMMAFPSRLNHLWETNTKTKDHSTQAPERAWNRWISTQFDLQIEKYFEFIESWAIQQQQLQPGQTTEFAGGRGGGGQNQTLTISLRVDETSNGGSNGDARNATSRNAVTPSPYKVALYLPYEGITNRTDGPKWSRQVLRALQEARVARVIATDDDSSSQSSMIDCLWKYTVVDKPTMKRSSHAYRPGYTAKQQEKLLQLMDDLIQVGVTYQIPSLVTIFQQYRIDIIEKIRIVDDAYQTKHNKKKGRRRRRKQNNDGENQDLNTTNTNTDMIDEEEDGVGGDGVLNEEYLMSDAKA